MTDRHAKVRSFLLGYDEAMRAAERSYERTKQIADIDYVQLEIEKRREVQRLKRAKSRRGRRIRRLITRKYMTGFWTGFIGTVIGLMIGVAIAMGIEAVFLGRGGEVHNTQDGE